MKMMTIRFLKKGEQAVLPKGVKLLPKAMQRRILERYYPFRLEGEEAVLQTTAGNSFHWRKQSVKLLEKLKKDGIEIIIPPAEGELPWDILPVAAGRKLTTLFAFEGAREALKRQGKDPEACRYLLAGGGEEMWRPAFLSMGTWVNHLAIFTEDVRKAKELEQELFQEHGLLTEVFASPKNPAFGQADVVFCCGMEQRKYERMLKEGAVWIDLIGNRPVLRRLTENRPDAAVCDGFFFRRGETQMEGRRAEAEAFLSCPIFRENWNFPLHETAGKEMLSALQGMGYAVSGFSRGGNRVKIRRKP